MTPQIKERIKQIKCGDIPDGYKKTEFGIFPCDWEVTNIGEICNIYSGGTPSTKKSEYWNGDIPWCSPTDITKSEKFITKTEKYISQQGLNNSSATLMPVNSILMCSRATIGPKCINKVPMATNQGFKNLVCKNPKDTEYVYYLLDNLVLRFIKASNGSTFLELSKSELEKARCCIPKTEYERTSIAKIITKWDEAIELYNKQIDLLKQYKSICLKKMFPAKRKSVPEWRFKGFTDDWEQRKLGEIAVITKGEQINKAKLSDFGTYYVLNGGMTPSGYTESFNTKANTISISEGGNSCGYVAYNNCDFWSGGHNYTLLQPKIDVKYLYQCLKRQEASIMALRVGSGLPNIQKNRLSEVAIAFPSPSEQIFISNYLCGIDNLITLYQRKIEKTENQRKVLQQYLLNGIVRCKLNERNND